MELTKTERLILANQYRIRAKLEGEDYRAEIEALERGYKSDWEHLFDSMWEVLDPGAARLVWSTLHLYDALQRHVGDAGDEAPVSLDDVKFHGFDGNTEVEYMAYANYITGALGRYEHLDVVKRGQLNSHVPMVEAYRNALDEWKRIGQPFAMERDQFDLLYRTLYPFRESKGSPK